MLKYIILVCRLLDKEIDAVISSTVSPYYPVLSAYAREYNIPLISPDLPQEISQYSTNYSFGIKPVTSRPMLKLFQQYGWKDIVYLYRERTNSSKFNRCFNKMKIRCYHLKNRSLCNFEYLGVFFFKKRAFLFGK